MEWILTNIDNIKVNTSVSKYSFDNYSLYTDKHYDNNYIIDGYIIPTQQYFSQYNHLKNSDLIKHLIYNNIPVEHAIKGIYSVIILNNNNFQLFNDRLGIRKYFYYINNNNFIISNKIDNIISNINISLNNISFPIFSIFHHFLGQYTLFNNIYFSQPAQSFNYTNNNFNINNYWNFDKLIQQNTINISPTDFSIKYLSIVKDYINYFNNPNISITITGGMDSRTLLAAILNLNINPHLFTFGNPLSKDVIFSKNIAKTLNLNYSNHYFIPTPLNYLSLTKEIIQNGNTITNIHRAHRLHAIKQELSISPNTKILFTGHMGGEGIRGLTINDYFSSPLIKNILYQNINPQIINNTLLKYFIKLEHNTTQQLTSIITNMPLFNLNSSQLRTFYYLYYVIAHIHHAQDINFYLDYVPIVVPIYLDYDYLNLLFSSNYNFLHKATSINKLENPYLYCNIIKNLYPQLAKPLFSNMFSPNEYLFNKYYYVFIKSLRNKLYKKNYPPNFDYTDWFFEYIKNQIPSINHHLFNYFDINSMKNSLLNSKHQSSEGYWHKYSHIINHSFNLNYYNL